MEKKTLETLTAPLAGLGDTQIRERIKRNAMTVVKLREKNIGHVEGYLRNASEWADRIGNAISLIQKNIDLYHASDPANQEIKEDCESAKNSIQNFIAELNFLYSRFKNRKIKITSVGAARSGKSEFTKLYTGLKENIIKTQKGNKDCTGAISYLNNASSLPMGQFRAEIHFKTSNELLKAVNLLLSQIIEIKGEGWAATSGLPKQFQDVQELRAINHTRLEAQFDNDPLEYHYALFGGFLRYFENFAYLSYLDHSVIDVTKSEDLEQYNYIQAREPKYLAVKKIELYVNIDPDGLFENFIVADTKGSSMMVGPDAEKEMIDAIDDSDAIFSMCMIENNVDGATRFYDRFLREYINSEGGNNPIRRDLPKRHFAVLNLKDGEPESNYDNVVDVLEKTGTTNCAYLGQLVCAAEPAKPKKFVNGVIVDMLDRISGHVLDFDIERLEKLNLSYDRMSRFIQKLTASLKKITLVTEVDKSRYVEKRLAEICVDIINDVLEACKLNCDIEADELENKNASIDFSVDEEEQRKVGTLYQLICDRIPEKDKEDDKDGACEILYEEVKNMNSVKSYARNDAGIAKYLGEFIVKFRERIEQNKDRFNDQQKLDIEKEKDAIFLKIWNRLCIPVSARNETDEFITGIIKIYNRNAYGGLSIPASLFHCYDVLYGYFRACEKPEDNADIIDDETLLDQLREQIDENELSDFLKEKYVSRTKALVKMYKELYNYFGSQQAAAIPLYIDHIEWLTCKDPDYYKKIKQAEADREMENVIKQVSPVLMPKKLKLSD